MELKLDEVIKLQASYTYSHDHAEVAAFVEIFAEDAVFALPSGDQIAGRDALEAFVIRSGGAGVHTSGAPLIRDDGTAVTPFIFASRGNARISSGYYHDTFARTQAGGLVFQRRTVETFPAAE